MSIRPFTFATVCSGIEAPSVAFAGLGMRANWFSEIAPFPSALLSHYYPETPNLGDMLSDRFLNVVKRAGRLDLLVGGTPCQGFSTSGLRKGLGDARSNLCLRFLECINVLRPTWFIWENVAGALSTNGGADFGRLLWEVGQCGYRWAYRVLDAKFFGVPQQRRRVFLVGTVGGRSPGEVLFEEPGPIIQNAFDNRGIVRLFCLNNQTGTVRKRPFAISLMTEAKVIKGFQSTNFVLDTKGLRSLTPLEFERLQGFPDNYTAIEFRGKPASDAQRYIALGNSIAVPVLRWIGKRLLECHST